MLLDETCFFLAADFDEASWQEDSKVFMETCQHLGIPSALERSRSGQGGHVWLFFEEAVPAVLARNLGAHILTESMERRPDIGFDSYDRFFPNQNTLPSGGLGNLIALPLQKQARERGNSLFVDGQFNPYPDQWAFLASVGRVSRMQAEALVKNAERQGAITGVRLVLTTEEESPWTASPSRLPKPAPIEGPLPEEVELVFADQIYIPKENLPAPLRNRLIRLAAFQNPEFYRAQAMRLPTHEKPRIICCAEDHPKHIALPRGCLDDARSLLGALGVKAKVRDDRYSGTRLEVSFRGELRPDQQPAAQAMLACDTGVLAATTAFGKTVVAAWLIAQRGVNTLVLVHRRQLLEQWVERLSMFLGLPPKSIGRLGGGRRKLTGVLDVALVQSLARKGVVDDRVGDYGHLVVDECHHVSAFSFELVARRAKAKYITGLSATVERKDGHHPIIFMQCGPIRHRVDARKQAEARPFDHRVLVRPTGFRMEMAPGMNARAFFQTLYGALAEDVSRNNMICGDVLAAVREGRFPLVLTERTDHLLSLERQLGEQVKHVVVLRGGMNKRDWQEAMERLSSVPAGEARVLLATGRYIGEGFDDSRLDSLFLAMPVSWRGTIAQYAGRLHRLHDGKREVRIYDYADLDVPMLSRMFDRRCRSYEALGYTLLLPASALPGWPVEVPLPIAPEWKREYAASVRRLIHDGVDVPLANLFVGVARTSPPGDVGEGRVRSASEAFLFRRLETLAATKGKFRLNVELPIPFNERSAMEVDFVCAESRVAIELDGAQHLADAEAYRRDRRKDALLQEQGYFVLRFLAEDLGKRLDAVLDAILRVQAHRARG
jgi:superfamily II DNA or RNA helicase